MFHLFCPIDLSAFFEVTRLDLNPIIRSWTIHCPGIPRFRGKCWDVRKTRHFGVSPDLEPSNILAKKGGKWIISHFCSTEIQDFFAKTILNWIMFHWQVQPFPPFQDAHFTDTPWWQERDTFAICLSMFVDGRKASPIVVFDCVNWHFSCFARNTAPKTCLTGNQRSKFVVCFTIFQKWFNMSPAAIVWREFLPGAGGSGLPGETFPLTPERFAWKIRHS